MQGQVTLVVGSDKGVYFVEVFCPFDASGFIQQALRSDYNVNQDGYKIRIQAPNGGTNPTRTLVQLKDRCIKADAVDLAKKIKSAFRADIIEHV
jgi:hypothetical protein